MTSSPWLASLRQPDVAIARLVVFHHSGGSAQFFRPWLEHLDAAVRLEAVELPGRGNRFGDPLVDSLPQAAEAIARAIAADATRMPLILFGHSLGAFLAYEVAWQLERRDVRIARLVASGALPPDRAEVDQLRHTMTDQELLDELRAFGATPAEVLEHEELMQLYLPIIRADFKMLETYDHGDERRPLTAPITAVAGREDHHVHATELPGWARYTSGQLAVQWFDGGHFYLAEDTAGVVGWLQDHLRSVGAL